MGTWLDPQGAQDHLQVPQPLQGQGCWSTLEPLTLQPWQGLAVTLDATPSSYDRRSQAWVFHISAGDSETQRLLPMKEQPPSMIDMLRTGRKLLTSII